jgi:hypothetical protein
MPRTVICLLLLLNLSGCIVSTVRPTIAHVHVGHSLTGWVDTPNQEGLLTTARRDAAIAAEHARYAVEGAADVANLKMHVGHVVHAIDPTLERQGPGTGYGLLRALDGYADHLRFAVESPDASANLKAGVGPVIDAVAAPRRDARLVLALARDVAATGKAETAVALALEIQSLCGRIVGDIDGSGRRLQELLAREQPAYAPVEQRYLFGLIRLPTGGWAWRQDLDKPAGSRYGGYQ